MQASKSISQAKKLLMKRVGYSKQQADEFIRIKLRNDIPILRTNQAGKFILGVTRMFLDGQLRTASSILSLNETLKLVSSDAHIKEYDKNLNGLTFDELTKRFAKSITDGLEAEREIINQMEFNTPSDYDIVHIDSFEHASKYSQYVEWCITSDEKMFDKYTSNGVNQFYFCLKHGFGQVKQTKGKNAPLDEYGLSMIAVSVNENGVLNTCTCRWNHDNKGNDSVMNAKEISQVVGVNFFDAFKPNRIFKDKVESVLQELRNGADIKCLFNEGCDYGYSLGFHFSAVKLNNKFNILNITKCEFVFDVWFDALGNFYKPNGETIKYGEFDCEAFAVVTLNGKCNYINTKFEFFSKSWFDFVSEFHLGVGLIEIDKKCNYITPNGEYISDFWFESATRFYEGFACVRLNGKWNLIDPKGNYLSDTWFDGCKYFFNHFCEVSINGKYNFINKNGEILSSTWFDGCSNFYDGFAGVMLNGKASFINTNGEVISDIWFDGMQDFKDGFAVVWVGKKYNYIDTNGEVISDIWFDGCYNFNNGFARVKLNDEWNFINDLGEVISDIWFDGVRDFKDRFACVKLNDKWNFINDLGELISNTWFHDSSRFRKGVARIRNGIKWNYINTDGDLLSEDWFDCCDYFEEDGTAIVKLKNVKYRIDYNGNLKAV